jgi:hypothetical protein
LDGVRLTDLVGLVAGVGAEERERDEVRVESDLPVDDFLLRVFILTLKGEERKKRSCSLSLQS